MHDSSMRRSQTTDLYDLVQADHNTSDGWKLPLATYIFGEASQGLDWAGPVLGSPCDALALLPCDGLKGRKDGLM